MQDLSRLLRASCQWGLGNHQGWWLQNFSEHQPAPINDCPPGEKGFPCKQPEPLFSVYAQFLPAFPHTRVEKPDSNSCHARQSQLWSLPAAQLLILDCIAGRVVTNLLWEENLWHILHLYKNYL